MYIINVDTRISIKCCDKIKKRDRELSKVQSSLSNVKIQGSYKNIMDIEMNLYFIKKRDSYSHSMELKHTLEILCSVFNFDNAYATKIRVYVYCLWL